MHDMCRELNINHTANPIVAICATATALTMEYLLMGVMSLYSNIPPFHYSIPPSYSSSSKAMGLGTLAEVSSMSSCLGAAFQ